MSQTAYKAFRNKPQAWVYVISCLFVCDFILCGYVPAEKRLKSLREVRARQLQMIQLAAAQGEELPALRQRLRDTRRTADRYDASVPSERAVGAFLQQIAAIMAKHRLTDHTVVRAEELEGQSQNCIPMQVTCRGALVDIFDFFCDLQKLDRLVRIEKVMLQNSDDFTGRITLRMDAAIFYQHGSHRGEEELADAKATGGASHGA